MKRNIEQEKLSVDMTVRDDSNFLSVFSQNENPTISSEVADFLENTIQNVYTDREIELTIHSDCIDEEEQKVYNKGIAQHYKNKVDSVEKELHHNSVVAMILAVVGVFILGVAVFMESYFNRPIWTEVVDIAAWVFLWEAFDIWAFRNKQLKVQKKRYSSLATMNVIYKNLDKK